MPAFNIEDAVKKMAGAASGVLKTKWPGIQSYAQTEFRKLAQTVTLIAEEKARGKITEQEALILLDMQRQASRTVLTTAEGLGILAAEEALDAALRAVKNLVNTAVGWTLL